MSDDLTAEYRQMIVDRCRQLSADARALEIVIGDTFGDHQMPDRDEIRRKLRDARDDAEYIAGRVSGEIEYD